MNHKHITELLEKKKEYRNKIFCRGFLFTDKEFPTDEYPFYGIWKYEIASGYNVYVHPDQHCFIKSNGSVTAILIGHAYNPFKMISDEDDIITSLINTDNSNEFYSELNELTGNFTIIVVTGDNVRIFGDATGMQTTFFAKINGQFYVSSHTNLIGDILNLEIDSYINRLIHYKYFKLFGNQLPGDLTQFKEVRRLTPNHYINYSNGQIEIKRFYLPQMLQMTDEEIVEKAIEILHNSLEMISCKWDKPAISMTGGCDSKTTLACASGLYDRFKYFSYSSLESENVDAIAAKQICEHLKLKHILYYVDEDSRKYNDLEAVDEILFWNTGGIRRSNRNDVRKRIVLDTQDDFDVEVKSWVSEIGRAYYSKRFSNRTDFGNKPSPRKCTTLYKFFLHNRKLVKETDEVFSKYIGGYLNSTEEGMIEWQEQFFWEYRMPSWNGLVITGEHNYSNEITIPYNNRMLIELLLSTSLKNRITDEIYILIRNKVNPAVDNTGIHVTNVKHTRSRAFLEDTYYRINTLTKR